MIRTIATSADAVAHPSPQQVLMVAHICSAGSSIDEALTNLEARAESVLSLLEKLNSESTHFGPVKQGEPFDPVAMRHQAIQKRQQQMRQQTGLASPSYEATGRRDSVTVRRRVQTYWTLKSASSEDTLRFVDRLQRSLLGRLGSTEDSTTETSPRWDSPSEVFASIPDTIISSLDEPALPGVPHFFYVTKLDENTRQQMVDDAIERARDEANRLLKQHGETAGRPASVTTVHASHHDSYGANKHLLKQSFGENWPMMESDEWTYISLDQEPAPFGMKVHVSFEIQKEP